MAVSGTTTFTLTRDEVISYALRKCGLLELGVTPDATTVINCTTALNMMIKSWAAKGSKLWTISEYTLPLLNGTNTYSIGPAVTGGVGQITFTSGTTVQRVAANGTATTVTALGSGGTPGTYAITFTGATAGVAATGTYTIDSTGAITSVTINAGSGYTTAPTISFPLGNITGVTAVAYLPILVTDKPLGLMQAWYRNTSVSPNIDIPLMVISLNDYNLLGSKGSTGSPNSAELQVLRDSSTLRIFVTPNATAAGTFETHILVKRPLMDAGTAAINQDFPSEWLYALGWNLAAEIAVDFGVPADKIQLIEMKAAKYLQEAEDFDVEQASIYFTPNPRFK